MSSPLVLKLVSSHFVPLSPSIAFIGTCPRQPCTQPLARRQSTGMCVRAEVCWKCAGRGCRQHTSPTCGTVPPGLCASSTTTCCPLSSNSIISASDTDDPTGSRTLLKTNWKSCPEGGDGGSGGAGGSSGGCGGGIGGDGGVGGSGNEGGLQGHGGGDGSPRRT